MFVKAHYLSQRINCDYKGSSREPKTRCLFPFILKNAKLLISMRTLYFDCFAGASGNMILGALIGLGVDQNALTAELARLNLPDISLRITDVDRSGISSKHVEVVGPHARVHRHVSHIVGVIGNSDLSESLKERAIAVFTRLAEAEAKIHGIDVNRVHFHEVGAMDAIVDVVGSCIGFEIL